VVALRAICWTGSAHSRIGLEKTRANVSSRGTSRTHSPLPGTSGTPTVGEPIDHVAPRR